MFDRRYAVKKLQAKLKDYIDIIQKVAKVEYKRIPSHMLDCEELVSIGIIALQALFKNKTEEQEITNIVSRTILAHPEINFTYIVDGKKLAR